MRNNIAQMSFSNRLKFFIRRHLIGILVEMAAVYGVFMVLECTVGWMFREMYR